MSIDKLKELLGMAKMEESGVDLRYLIGKAIDAYDYFKVAGKNLEGTVGRAIRYEQHLDSLKDLLSILDSPEFSRKLRNESQEGRDGEFIEVGRKFKTKVFDSDSEANSFIDRNKENGKHVWGVIGTDGNKVHVAKLNDKGEKQPGYTHEKESNKRKENNTFEVNPEFFQLKGIKQWYDGLKKQGLLESFKSFDEFKKSINRDEIKNILVKEYKSDIQEEELDLLIEQAYELHKKDLAEEEGFDGTLSDLGELPKYAYGVVGSKGGSKKLVTKTKKIKKRKHEDITDIEEPKDIIKTIVRELEGEIILLFPEDYNPVNKTIGSYMHVGQHSDASVFLIDDLSRPTDEVEVHRLVDEYERHYNCKLEIMDYMSPADIIKAPRHEGVTEELDNRKEVAKELKSVLTKKFGKVSVKSGLGKTPYISVIIRESEFPEDFRILCLKTVYPSFTLGGDSPWSTTAGNVHKQYITLKAPEWEKVLDSMLSSKTEDYSDSLDEPDYGMEDEEVYEGINGFIYFDNVKKKYYVTDREGKAVGEYFEDTTDGFEKAMLLLQSIEPPREKEEKDEAYTQKFMIRKGDTEWDKDFTEDELRQLLAQDAERGATDVGGIGVPVDTSISEMPLSHILYSLRKAGYEVKSVNQYQIDNLRAKLKKRPFDKSKADELEKKYFSRKANESFKNYIQVKDIEENFSLMQDVVDIESTLERIGVTDEELGHKTPFMFKTDVDFLFIDSKGSDCIYAGKGKPESHRRIYRIS